MASPDIKKKYGLGPIESYHYLNQSGVYEVKDVDDGDDFNMTIHCMKNIGFSHTEIE